MPTKKTKKTERSTPKSALKRFAVFSGNTFYPNGGWGDFQSSHAALAEAEDSPVPGDWLQIVDLTTGRVVVSRKQ